MHTTKLLAVGGLLGLDMWVYIVAAAVALVIAVVAFLLGIARKNMNMLSALPKTRQEESSARQ